MATGSPRRQAQLKDRFLDCEWIQLRGNVETRLRKIVDKDEADGTILAVAGLSRLGFKKLSRFAFYTFGDRRDGACSRAKVRLPFNRELKTKKFLPF